MWSFTATVIPEPCVIKVVSNRNTFRSLRIPETFGRLFVYGQFQLFFSSLVAFAAPALQPKKKGETTVTALSLPKDILTNLY